MKAIHLGAAALCAQVGLAVPHAGHQKHRHAARHLETYYSTITDVVTITAPNAVVWVDQFGNVISTEYRGHVQSPAPSETVSTSVPIPVDTNTVASSSVIPTDAAPLPTTSASIRFSSVDTTTSSSPAVTSAPTSASQAPATGSSTTSSGVSGDDDNSAGGGGFGICYELITDSGCKTKDQISSDFAFLAGQGFSKVRVYDIGCDLGPVAQAASAANMQLVAGLNTITNVATDIGTLIGFLTGNWASVDTIVIGNEVVNNGGDPNAVVAALGVARAALSAAGYTKNVVTVDVWSQLLRYPQLCQNSDYCAANAHAYFDVNTNADQAGTYVSNISQQLAAIANGKSVVITESGWPWQGQANGDAIPSPANQQTAVSGLRSAFASNPGGLFLFQAYDATYKAPGPLGVEQFFGIYGH
ncbi:hypothetical protein, variant [Exophiala oligosperma]|uniref:Uncharacterized protein n=2 Tax=Chaetothyriales TaxID=34395 RepID=A0A0D2ATF5_9EURO|nr:uncharacterized protein PV06_04270 [Exophiala oligosperma]XP_016263347.1 hypothetical protein, variant [Exophiala oligosperma]KAJ9636153.1 Cell surface mannoprotein mp65 [Knufia peltigerae]KIW43130.1 hypothetical protein PV06_04270 [Exophiala oligosperma]KIW43131.1 hypothetical protein, variant [Exophiala oligosperma]